MGYAVKYAINNPKKLNKTQLTVYQKVIKKQSD